VRIVVGITGASGAVYALSLLKVLGDLGAERHAVVSDMGAKVLFHECAVTLGELAGFCECLHDNRNLASSIASGSYHADAMVIVPCSMKTLAAVAHGWSDSLVTRAADVAVKEKRNLIIVPREMPLSAIHLENMLKLAKLGVTILPPSPAFYHHPQSLTDIVKFVVGKITDQLGLEHNLYQRWEGEEP
jgi:4-hydroxy-3-polyprenylbenzoate decarboxylase